MLSCYACLNDLDFLLLIFEIFELDVEIIGVIYWEYMSCYIILNIYKLFEKLWKLYRNYIKLYKISMKLYENCMKLYEIIWNEYEICNKWDCFLKC